MGRRFNPDSRLHFFCGFPQENGDFLETVSSSATGIASGDGSGSLAATLLQSPLTQGKECGVGYSSLWTDIMKVISNSYRIYRRQVSGYFYFVDETLRKPKHTSLQTKDPKQAQRILDARLMGRTLPAMAKEVGNAYLREGDPEVNSHTWRRVIKELLVCKNRPFLLYFKKSSTEANPLQA